MKVYLDGGCVIILVILKRKKRFAIVVRVSTFIPVLPFGFINFSLNFIDFLFSPLVHLFLPNNATATTTAARIAAY